MTETSPQNIWYRLRELDISWARVVSNLLSPPIAWAVWAFPTAFRYAESPQQALLWGVIYSLLICLLPVGYVAWMVKQGRISDLHMRNRNERIRPFLVSIVLTTVAWWILRLMGAPAVLPLIALVSIFQISLLALISLVWQVSMHTMSITGVTMANFMLYGFGSLWVMIPLLLLVSAARYRLKRHTPAQLFVGMLVGLFVPLIVLPLIMVVI